jgi:hypothetical protein
VSLIYHHPPRNFFIGRFAHHFLVLDSFLCICAPVCWLLVRQSALPNSFLCTLTNTEFSVQGKG